ncbi:threonyl-tRNA synthetase [Malassezia pachydermatis]|uniref:threonine--tRNA ligase n=1 Tax=Malassezia pachydermatis TaxID=77020 RepID=A0A0M9VRF4_9BASI|nr:threonyl-trna synthetase [Malassezia pachydermatis]KOS16432.1 threonyl-trna synthetase [Malassezia pachydermatis]
MLLLALARSRGSLAHGWPSAGRLWALRTASLRTGTVAFADPRTVRLSTAYQGRTSVAQILNDACSNEAGAYVVARDDQGRPVSLGATLEQLPSTLTFLPFESDDKLAQHTFWLSSAYVLVAALQQVCGTTACAAPSVTESVGTLADGTSGFAVECLRCESLAPVPCSADLVEARRHVQEALTRLVDHTRTHGPPKLSSEEMSAVEQCMKQLCTKSRELRVETMAWPDAFQRLAHHPFALRTVVERAEQGQAVDVVYVGETAVGVLPKDATLLRRTKPIKAIKLLGWSTASLPAYLAKDATQPLLRLRGIAFPSSSELQQYTARVAESEKSDHRFIGTQQSLFFAHDSSPGSPFVMPHGMRLQRRVERVIRDLYDAFGYEEVQSPQLYRSALWKQSGHWDKYRDDMFSAQGFACCDAHDDVFGLKPMNCPGHCVMFAHQPRSYRELPMRLAEFSPLHRNEASGALTGLTRVRRFHQDDAHVFCTASQVGQEIHSMLHMLSLAYRVFGFGDRFELVLSTRPENYLGQIDVWEHAEASLKQALDATGKPWSLNEGDGAFYGPKIDIRLVDAMGRKHQTATIQLDFQLPERFQLEYAQAANEPTNVQIRPGYARPVMIHRAILGSFERFMAILIEQCKGWWPFWLNPRQAVVIPAFSGDAAMHDSVVAYAQHVQHVLAGSPFDAHEARNPFLSARMAHHTLEVPPRARFHVELPPHYLSPTGDTLGKKVRHSQLSRYNFLLIVGPHEAQTGTVNVRLRDEKAAPAWHAGSDAAETTPCKVQDMIGAVVRATFPDRFPPDTPLSIDLGAWTLPDVQRLFRVLDALHV